MNFAALLVLVALTGTVCSSCPKHCIPAVNVTELYIRHVSPLKDTSVAPWDLVEDKQVGRRPYSITKAVCRKCRNSDMVEKPINLQISVFQKFWVGKDEKLCLCPFLLPVGCTCVMKE